MLPPFMKLQAEKQMLEEAVPSSPPPYISVNVGAEPSTRPESQARLVSIVSVGCQTDSPIGPTTAFDMEWKSFPAHSDLNLLEVHREIFQEQTGAKSSYATPYDAFVAIWDHTLVEKIVKETNVFASRLIARMTAQGLMRPSSRTAKWKDTTVDEMYVFLAIVLTMGTLVKARIQDYCSTYKNIFSTPGVNENISINRFKLLSRCIYFNNDFLMPTNTRGASARLFKTVKRCCSSDFYARWNSSTKNGTDLRLGVRALLIIARLTVNEKKVHRRWFPCMWNSSTKNGTDSRLGVRALLIIARLTMNEKKVQRRWFPRMWNSSTKNGTDLRLGVLVLLIIARLTVDE
ncbi:PiggyBac transposable element-derived protein 4 [Eumeta japonica]|uniref:PiggyBac transposable element-derived protein 4 n=1 Tax=Eumeta variegata TaxID=151549 RepID=A0A4C1ZGB7_EUMVA|nr:PiggyBac transposable element-derived protein 4 [Eumeta japonica]